MDGSIRRITELFDGSSKHLVIPVYQRNYDWAVKHCARLFDDFVEIMREDRETHFFGAIVGHAENAFRYVVIDGQQRLTTTSLVMLALVHSLDSGAVAADEPQLAARIRRSYLVLEHEYDDAKFKLKPVKDDNDAYTRLLRGDKPIETSNITANYRYFLDRIARGELTGDQIWAAIERLQVMVLDLERQDDPQRIFESINSTGLELSEADKIRNIVLMRLPVHEQEDLYENYWNRIEKAVDFHTDWFIRFYLVSKTGKTPRMDAVYEAFREYQKSSGSSIRQIVSDMRDYAEYSEKLNGAATGIPAADKRLRRFNIIKHDVTLPLTMPLLGEVEAGIVAPDDFAEVIHIIDAYIFRRFVCNVPTNALNKIFATVYSEVRRLRGEGDRFADVLTYSLRRRATSGRFPDDEEFAEAFASRDLYKIKGENRTYLFECLENNWSNDTHDIASALVSQAISVEHIMPQTLTAAWRGELGENAEEIHAAWLNRIGNLTVTGYNPSYSNSSFTDKKTRTDGFDDSPYRLNSLLRSTDVWTDTQMAERTRALTKLALQYWSLPTTGFEPYTPPLPTEPMGDDENFTNREIVAFDFLDTRKTVKSWKEAMVEVIRLLLESNREAIFAYAGQTNDLNAFGDSREPASNETLVIPGLAVVASTSTRSKMILLRRLFAHLDVDTEELVFTLRNTEGEEVGPPEDDDEPLAELTKFLPELDEFASSSATQEDTHRLQEEFTAAFAEYRVDNPQSVLPGKSLPDLAHEEFIAAADQNQLLAAMSMLFQAESIMPGQFHRVTTDGTMSRWLKALRSCALTSNGVL